MSAKPYKPVGDYKPQASSKALKLIRFLETQPSGTEISTTGISDLLDCSPVNVARFLNAAVSHGVIQVRKTGPKRNSPLAWSLVGASPIEESPDSVTQDDEIFDPRLLMKQRTIQAGSEPAPKTTAVRSVFEMGATV